MMGNDMRVMKFEILVDKIRNCVGWCWSDGHRESLQGKSFLGLYKQSFQQYLTAVYDYDSLSAYGKIIVKPSEEKKLDAYKDIQKKVDVIKYIGPPFNNILSRKYKILFVFWAMMVLTVEDTDKEESLSLVCDLARMLELSDEDVMDILHVIQVIYHKNEEGVNFHSEYTEEIFQNLMATWGVPILESKLNKGSE